MVAAFNIAAFATPAAFADDLLDSKDKESRQRTGATAKNQAAAPANAQGPWITDVIRVTARGTANDWPSALATDVLTYQEAIAAPSDFQDLITRVPGVGATGGGTAMASASRG